MIKAGVVLVLLICGLVPSPTTAQSEAWERTMREGLTALQLGQPSKGLQDLEKALHIAVAQFGPNHQNVATIMHNLALAYTTQGRDTEAEPLYLRALAINEQALGPEHPSVGMSLDNLAMRYLAQGRETEAEPLLRRALAIFEKTFGLDHPNIAIILRNLAAAYMAQDRGAEAEPLVRRALAILEQAAGPDHPFVANALDLLAAALRTQGRAADAEPLLRRALAINEQAFGPDHPSVAQSLNNLAVHYSTDGRHAEADPLYHRALAILEQALGPDHPDIAPSLLNLGNLYRTMGRDAEAEQLYQRSLAISEQTFGLDSPRVAADLTNLADLYRTQGRHAEALTHIRRAMHFHRQRTLQRLAMPTGLDQEISAVQLIYRNHVMIAWAAEDTSNGPSFAAEALESAQLASANETAATALRVAARFSSSDGALAALVREQDDLANRWRALDRRIVAGTAIAPEQRVPEAAAVLRSELAAVTERLEAIGDEVAERFPDYADLVSVASVPLDEARDLLAPSEALLVTLLVSGGEEAAEEEALHVWLIGRERTEWHRVGLDRGQLTRDIARLRAGLDPRQGGGIRQRFDAELAHELYRVVFPFEAGALDEIRHLLVVPHGPLESLPLHLLVTTSPAAGTALQDLDWLVRSFAVTTLPAVTTLRALRRTARPSAAPEPFIGIGDPVLGSDIEDVRMADLFDTEGLGRVEQLMMLAPLPNTREELHALAEALGGGKDSLLLGPAATEAAVKAADLARARVVAFASHALVAGELQGLAEPAIVLTPPVVASEEDDGLLTASEVAQLSLDADFVLLSACNTAAPDGTLGASGLSGLAKAFVYAGARSLLVSHWSVYSEPAQRLTTGMFEELARAPGIGGAEALRRSMLAMIDEGGPLYAHPSAWAPFVVVGEGGAP